LVFFIKGCRSNKWTKSLEWGINRENHMLRAFIIFNRIGWIIFQLWLMSNKTVDILMIILYYFVTAAYFSYCYCFPPSLDTYNTHGHGSLSVIGAFRIFVFRLAFGVRACLVLSTLKMVTKLQKARAIRKKKYQESTQSKYVVESSNSTTIEPCSINTVREVVETDISILCNYWKMY